MSDRLLKESDVIETVTQYISCDYPTEERAREDAELLIGQIPSANIPHSDDWEKYSDRLWKIAYERGKAEETNKPQGEWIETNKFHYGAKVFKCSVCGAEISDVPTVNGVPEYKGCPYCLTRMKE